VYVTVNMNLLVLPLNAIHHSALVVPGPWPLILSCRRTQLAWALPCHLHICLHCSSWSWN